MRPLPHFFSSSFLSTPSARRATRCRAASNTGHCISIHALREEGDLEPETLSFLSVVISIHALREEGDGRNHAGLSVHDKFLSTPSARRATAKTEKNISAFVSL